MNASTQQLSLLELKAPLYFAKIPQAYETDLPPSDEELINLLLEKTRPSIPGHRNGYANDPGRAFLDAIGLGDRIPDNHIYCPSRLYHQMAALEQRTSLFELLHHWVGFLQSADYLSGKKNIISRASIDVFQVDTLLVDARKVSMAEVPALCMKLQQQNFPAVMVPSAFTEGSIVLFFSEQKTAVAIEQLPVQQEYDPVSQRLMVKTERGEGLLDIPLSSVFAEDQITSAV